jgi:hypothetical protein
LKKINNVLNSHFTDEELEGKLKFLFLNTGLLEIAGKSNSKITFDNFMEFLNKEF